MGPETSPKKIPRTSDKADLISLCSCNGCETVRCYSTKKTTTNSDDDENFSKTCIYFTNITIKKSCSNTDTSAKGTTDTTNNKMSRCEICGKENEVKDSSNSKKNLIANNKTNAGQSDNVPHLNKKESKDKQSIASDTINKLISEWGICRQNIMKDLPSNKFPVLDTKKSMCENCLKNIHKLNNDVDTFNKGLVSEVYKFNNNINNIAEPNFILPENKQTSKSKCLSDIQPKCSTCAIKYGSIPRKNLVDTKTICKQDMQSKGEACRTNNRITERICKKQSNCKICGRYLNVTRQIEKTDTRKLQQSYTADNESIPKKEKPYIKSLCNICSRDLKTHGKLNSDPTETQVTTELKPKCARNYETCYLTCSVNNVLTPTKIRSKCSNCEKKDFEVYSNTDDYGKIRYHKMNKEVDARSKCKEIKSGCFTKLQKKTPIDCGNSFILCTCKSHENLKQTNFARTRDCRVINVHNATVDYKHDINPSAAKLSAQIMNVPYEDFQESFNYTKQDNISTKTQMKNNLSDEIIKRIKDVYRACSCKICECIAGKNLKFDNECNCKPCNCDYCKSNKINTNCPAEIGFGVTRKKQNKYCECTPCDCVRCMPPRTFIAASVLENRHANNCSCTPCRCLECERNYFPMSTHLTHDMSTDMVRNCGCDQCLDQRCRGAGGTEDCRCEMPSKAICKPVEKDSHEYDIRRASVCHQRNMKKQNNFDTIAMYASVSSNFAPLGTLKEACSCEECECFACQNEDDKLSIETILKPQLKLNEQSIKTNNCVCKSCECEVCSYNKDIPECDKKYQDAGCACGECYCINCQTMVKSSTTIKEAKPIGKIYYKNSFNSGSQQCDDYDLTTSGSSRTYGNKQGHHVCMNATLNKNCYTKNINYDHEHLFDSYNRHIEQYQNKDTCLFYKTFCNFQDIEDEQQPATDSSMFYKGSQEDFSIKINHFHKDLNLCSNTDKDDVVKSDEHFQANVEKTTKRHQNKFSKDSEYSLFGTNKIKGHPEIEQLQLPLSNCKPNYSKSTLHSCLKDVLTFNEDLNLNSFNTVHNLNKSKTIYPTHTYESDYFSGYGQEIKPFSNLHQNLCENKFEREKIFLESEVCNKNYTNDLIWDMPLVLNCNKSNFPNNQIDYERVHKTLKEAKDFSVQLIRLLEKYDRANKDFQSVSEKLKLSHGLNVLSKVGSGQFILIDKANNDHATSQNTVNKENDGKNHIDARINANISDLMSTDESAIQRKNPKETNIEISNQGEKEQNDQESLKTTESKEKSESMESKKTIESTVAAEDNINVKSEILSQRKLDKSMMQSLHNNINKENIILKTEEKTNNDQLNEFKEITLPGFALHNTMAPANNIQNRIDSLTDQLLDTIKENVLGKYEDILLSRNVKKYDRSVSVSDDFAVVLSQESEINNYQDWSISKKNYYLSHNQNIKDSFTSPIHEVVPKLEMQSMYVQTSIEKHIDKPKVKEIIKVKSAFSVPRNKTLQVEKESATHCGSMIDKSLWKTNDQRKSSKSTLTSRTELDLKQQPQFNVAHYSQPCQLPRSKCSCEDLKVCSLSGRRVSDHTVMMKWSKPKVAEGVLGYELLVDGRPVQKIIDPARCMAVVTCLPNCEKVLLTMRTVLDMPLRSGHKPTVTIIYRPRLKKK